MAFSSPLDLSSSETYDVEILVDSNSNAAGNNTGFDGLIFNGEVVPEPSSALLVFAGLGLAMRRRR
ncbi:MAG: PEP-CTERM sorting domain-containing protein [Akkermansiaceae bacterium]